MKKMNRKRALQLMAASGAGILTGGLLASTPQSKMLERPIPSSKEMLPVVGVGSWLQFDVGSNVEERAALAKVLHEVAKGGGRCIDSSPMYGTAEQVIGDLTQETNIAEHFFYATKVWTTGKQAGIQQMESSIAKMKRQRMDLMQIHNLTDWETQLETLLDWKRAGKIKYIGITHYTTSMYGALQRVFEKHPIDFVQFNYSILTRDAEKSILPAARDNGVAVIINGPLEKGSLFSKVGGKDLPTWAKDYEINSWAQFFLKYIAAHPAVNCVIPGTSNPKHAADNMLAGHGTMPDEAGRKKMVAYLQGL